MKTNYLALSTVEASDISRDFARAALSRHPTFFAACDYKDAAKVMGKQFTKETEIRLAALSCVDFKAMPESLLAFVESLAAEILA